MFTKIYLIRHGEIINSEPKRYMGHIDIPLSEKGIKQIEQVAKYLFQNCSNSSNPRKGGFLTAVYCSDLSRAVKSAEIIAKHHGLKAIIMPELREMNFGLWEGMTFDEIKEKYPDEFGAWANNPLEHTPVGGESTLQVRDRAIKALDKILNFRIQGFKGSSEKINNSLQSPNPQTLEPFSAKNIAIVAHGGINRIILCHLLGIPLENIFRIEQDYAAVNIIEFYENYPVVKLINYSAQTTANE